MAGMEFLSSTDEHIALFDKLPPQLKAEKWLKDPNAIFLETRSTGLDEYAEIIEIIITDNKGAPVFHSHIKPTIPFSDAISEKYRIDAKQLRKAPSWKKVLENIKFLLTNRPIIVYNSRLDGRLIKQSCRAHTGRMPKWVDELEFCCVMKLANEHFDCADNDYGVLTLAQACEEAGFAYYPSADIQREVRKVKRILENIAQE